MNADANEIEKYREAGRILQEVLREVADKVKVGASVLEVAEFVERRIVEKGGRPAFPCNISRNDEAAHATPRLGDGSLFGRDMVKVDAGCHVDGYIADGAITIDLSGNEELVKASRDALERALEIVKAGVSVGEIGEVIERTISEYGYKPVVNLTGHGLKRYDAHAPPAIPNRGIKSRIKLNAGDVIAIEPFATNGLGRVSERGSAEIYRVEKLKPVRLPAARKLLAEVEKYGGLPFAKRWLKLEGVDFALRNLENLGIVRSYPVLKEDGGGLVSQAEHTLIVTQNGYELIA